MRRECGRRAAARGPRAGGRSEAAARKPKRVAAGDRARDPAPRAAWRSRPQFGRATRPSGIQTSKHLWLTIMYGGRGAEPVWGRTELWSFVGAGRTQKAGD